VALLKEKFSYERVVTIGDGATDLETCPPAVGSIYDGFCKCWQTVRSKKNGPDRAELKSVRTAFLLTLFLPEILSGYYLVQGGRGVTGFPKIHESLTVCLEKKSNIFGVKCHRVHLSRPRKTTVKSQKTTIFE
jgi:hypothetical protein